MYSDTEKKYSVLFSVQKKPYIELIKINGKVDEVEKDDPDLPDENISTAEDIYDLSEINLGQVAFSLATCQSKEEMREFLRKYQCSMVYDYDKLIPVEESSPWVEYLNIDQADIKQFIKIVLLNPAPTWADGVPSSRRLPIFHYLRQTDNITRYFQDITLKPVVIDREEAWRGLNLKGGIFSPGLQRNMSMWDKSWDKKSKSPEQLYSQITKLQTAGWEYETDNLLALAWLELYIMAERNITVRQCKRCKGYFVPKVPKTFFCENCLKTYSNQALYAAKKWESITEEEKNKIRRRNAQVKIRTRYVKKLFKEGMSVQEIAKSIWKDEEWVRDRLTGKKNSWSQP